MSIRVDMGSFYHDAYAYKNYIVIVFVSFFYLFLLLSALNRLKFLQFKFLARLGELTYPLYLIHGFGLGAFMFLSGKVNTYLLLIFVIALMLFLSWLIFRFIEKTSKQPFKTGLNRLLDHLS